MLLIDGNAILHRAYYALPDWRNRSGEATAGVYGFLSMFLKAIEEMKPTHLAVVFDTPEPTFRHNLYVGYQSNREKERQISEDIWGQVDKLKIVFEKMNVPVFAVPGFEADDVIGTLASQCKMQNVECTIITGDRDLMQLVDDKVRLFMPQKGLSDGIIVDEAKVMEKMGVHPRQIVDYKGLVGDSSDNYPGVSGIGPKTAGHLLAEYESLDKIYSEISNPKTQVPIKVRQKLLDGYEAAKLSQQLATIKRDVSITLQLSKAEIPDKETILEVLKQLGYKSLIKRVGGEVQEADDKQAKLFE